MGLAKIPKALGRGKSVLQAYRVEDPIIADMAECEFDRISLEEGIKNLKSAV